MLRIYPPLSAGGEQMKKIKKYPCCYCDKSFALQSQLVVHIRQHTGEKPFECEHCHKAFASLKVLKVHERIHTGERPYKCSFCEKSFSAYANLVVHKRIHTNEKPYQCKLCKRAFEHSGNLNRHFRAHMTDFGYRCILCTKLFAEEHEILEHTKKEHRNEYLNYIINDPEYKDSLLKENSLHDSNNSSNSQLSCNYGTKNSSLHNICNDNNNDSIVNNDKRVIHGNINDNVINFIENINPALNIKSENLSNDFSSSYKLGYSVPNTQSTSTSNIFLPDSNYIKSEKEINNYKLSNDDNTSFLIRKRLNNSPSNSLHNLRCLKEEEEDQSSTDEKAQMLFDPPPLIPIEEVDNLEMEYESTSEQHSLLQNRLTLQEDVNILKHRSNYEKINYEQDHTKYYTTSPVQNSPSTSNYHDQYHNYYSPRENPDTVGDNPSMKYFLVSEFKKYAFKKKVEKLLLILFGKAKLKEYKWPQKSCEQVLISILDDIGQRSCSDVRVDEEERFLINVQFLIERSFPSEKAWIDLNWKGKPTDFIVDQILSQSLH